MTDKKLYIPCDDCKFNDDSVDCQNCEFGQALNEVRRLSEVIDFYADPETYFAVLIVGDHPCGDFVTDLSIIPGDYIARPGMRARQALGFGCAYLNRDIEKDTE